MTAALITAITSLLISFLTLFQSLKTQRLQKLQFDKTQKRALTTKLYELRLIHYPKAFEITECLRMPKGGGYDPSMILNVKDELNLWKSGMINMIISYDALLAFRELRKALNKQPGNGNIYTQEQESNIWKARAHFRKCLRIDLGLLHEG